MAAAAGSQAEFQAEAVARVGSPAARAVAEGSQVVVLVAVLALVLEAALKVEVAVLDLDLDLEEVLKVEEALKALEVVGASRAAAMARSGWGCAEWSWCPAYLREPHPTCAARSASRARGWKTAIQPPHRTRTAASIGAPPR